MILRWTQKDRDYLHSKLLFCLITDKINRKMRFSDHVRLIELEIDFDVLSNSSLKAIDDYLKQFDKYIGGHK